MDRTKNASRNIVWGMVNRIITALLPFLSRTIILYRLGSLYLGIGSLFTSVLGMLSLAELGFSSAIIFSMYKPIAEEDNDMVCALLLFYRRCYRVIGSVILILGLALIPFLKYFIKGDYPENINIYVVYLIYLFNTVISYMLFAYKKSLLQANQRADVDSKISMVTMIVQHILQIVLVLWFGDYYLFVMVMPFMTLAGNLLVNARTNKMFPQYVCRGTLYREYYHSLMKKLGGLIFQKIGNVVLGSVDNIVISAFLGLTVLACYNNYYCIIAALFGMIGVVSNSLKGGVGHAVAKDSLEKNYKNFNTFNLLYTMMVSWISICFLCFVQPFMELWVGENYMLPDHIALLAAVYIFTFKWCDMLYVYQEAKGIWWRTKFVPLTAAAVNLAVNITLVKRIGLPGILISTIVSVLFIYDLGYAKILFREYFTDTGGFRRYIIRQIYYLFGEILLLSFCTAICLAFPAGSLWLRWLRSFGCALMASLLLILEYKWLPEFHEARQYVARMLGK